MPRSPSGASATPSPRVSIKSLELNALHTSQIQDMVHLNGNRSNEEVDEIEAAAQDGRHDNQAVRLPIFSQACGKQRRTGENVGQADAMRRRPPDKQDVAQADEGHQKDRCDSRTAI